MRVVKSEESHNRETEVGESEESYNRRIIVEQLLFLLFSD